MVAQVGIYPAARLHRRALAANAGMWPCWALAAWAPRVDDIHHVGRLALGAMRAPPAARHCEDGVLAAWAPRSDDFNHVGSLALGAVRGPPAARLCEVGALAAWAPHAVNIHHVGAALRLHCLSPHGYGRQVWCLHTSLAPYQLAEQANHHP